MRRVILIFLISIMASGFGFSPPVDRGETTKVSDIRLNQSRKKSNNAAVLITSVAALGGHGSGSYLRYRGFHIVVTASHVADMSDKGKMIVHGQDFEFVEAIVIYDDPEQDVAFLLLEEPLETRDPIPLKLPSKPLPIGAPVTYAGFPGDMDMLSFEGYVSGHRNYDSSSFTIVHTFGWLGVSGSGIFDISGRLVGVAMGISKVKSPWVGFPPILTEDVVWSADTFNIDTDKLMMGICGELIFDDRKCKSYLGN